MVLTVRNPTSKQSLPTGGAAGSASTSVSLETSRVVARIRASARAIEQGGMQALAFQAMGTRCSVSCSALPGRRDEINSLVIEWVGAFEAKYSRFIPSSLISRINAAAGRDWVQVDRETEELFALCDQMHFITGGIFDPTSLPLLQIWDWKTGVIPSEEAILAARRLVGWRKFERAPGRVFLPQRGMGLDLGGMGKEYAVDRVAQLLSGAGVAGAMVDFGADVRAIGLPGDGRPGWHIGLQDPKSPARCWCGLGLREGAVATSGDSVRRFEKDGRRFGHILDVRTGHPVSNGCLAASVVAPSCTLAGMLSTALFVLGPEEGMRLLDAQYGSAGAIVADKGVVTSRRFYEHVVS